MNILLIPHNTSTCSMTLSDGIYMLIGISIVIWICRIIVEKFF
jgi:hypothetical protein